MNEERIGTLDRRRLLRILVSAAPLAYVACKREGEPGQIEGVTSGETEYVEEARAEAAESPRDAPELGGPVEHDVPEPRVDEGGYLDCSEGVEIAESSKEKREALGYVSKAGAQAERCYTCAVWQPPAEGKSVCGGCKLFSGPVNANGWCKAYAPRVS